MEIIIGFSGICLGFVICLAWIVYTKNDLSFLDDKTVIYPVDKPSPNRVFIERHADRRLPDQTWREQVARAYKVMPVNKPVIISTPKNIIDEIDDFFKDRT